MRSDINKKIAKSFTASLFILLSIFSISFAQDPFTLPPAPSIPENDISGSSGFTGPSGFRIDGFTGQEAPLPEVNTFSCKLGEAKTFRELVINFALGCVLSPLAYVVVGVSVIIFLYGILKFIRSEGDDKQQGREFIVWGLVGLFVMVSIWGLVNILSSTFNLNNASLNTSSLTR